ECLQLPAAWYQMRDRTIWNFAASNVTSVTIVQRGQTRKLLRSAAGEWSLAPPYLGAINPFAPEVTIQDLGHLRAESWLARTNALPEWMKFKETAHQVTVEARIGEQLQNFAIAFGRTGPRGHPYAAVQLEGELVAFEFPRQLYEE